MLIGLAGYAGAGKDEAANTMVAHFGYTRMAFADSIRDIAAAINPIVGCHTVHPIYYNEAIAEFGYADAKRLLPEFRRFLQRLGTDAMRDCIDKDFWVDAAFNSMIPGKKYVFTDVRFKNEAQAIRAAGGTVWRIERPNVRAANAHASEHDLDGWDYDTTLVNDGDVDDLRIAVGVLVQAPPRTGVMHTGIRSETTI